jgi:protein tyrosine phosphatase
VSGCARFVASVSSISESQVCRAQSRMSDGRPSVWQLASEYLQNLDMSTDVLQQRFLSIRQPFGSHLTTISAKKRKNAGRNRYSNILPFDHNRVKVFINEPEGSRGRYINASFMKVSVSQLELSNP